MNVALFGNRALSEAQVKMRSDPNPIELEFLERGRTNVDVVAHTCIPSTGRWGLRLRQEASCECDEFHDNLCYRVKLCLKGPNMN